MQFDSMTEQLNNMLQELLSKISGQEQDWNKVIEKISTEMDCKVREGLTEAVIFKAAVLFLVKNDQKSILEQLHNQPVFKTITLL